MPSENKLEISPRAVKKKLEDQDDFVLLDCREQDEYDLVHIEQARLLAMSELEEKVNEINDLKQKKIVVYCHHGRRSLMVTNWLLGHGFTDVKSMTGGIDLWAEQIASEMKRY